MIFYKDVFAKKVAMNQTNQQIMHMCNNATVISKFKSWTNLFAFHFTLMPLGKAWIHLFFN